MKLQARGLTVSVARRVSLLSACSQERRRSPLISPGGAAPFQLIAPLPAFMQSDLADRTTRQTRSAAHLGAYTLLLPLPVGVRRHLLAKICHCLARIYTTLARPRPRPNAHSQSSLLCPTQALVLRRGRLVLLDEQPLLLFDHPPGVKSTYIEVTHLAAHFMISLMYSRRMLSDSVSIFVYAMNGPKLTTISV